MNWNKGEIKILKEIIFLKNKFDNHKELLNELKQTLRTRELWWLCSRSDVPPYTFCWNYSSEKQSYNDSFECIKDIFILEGRSQFISYMLEDCNIYGPPIFSLFNPESNYHDDWNSCVDLIIHNRLKIFKLFLDNLNEISIIWVKKYVKWNDCNYPTPNNKEIVLENFIQHIMNEYTTMTHLYEMKKILNFLEICLEKLRNVQQDHRTTMQENVGGLMQLVV
jgi:hypothetical protein